MTHYQPQPTQPWQPAPRRKRRVLPWLLGGLLALAVLCGIGGAIALATDSGQEGFKDAVAADESVAPTTGAPSAKAPAVKATKPAAPKPVLVAKGKGIKKTAKFRTDDDWKLSYTFDCAGFGKGNFIVTLYTNGALSDVLTNELAAKGKDTVPVYKDGEHYLSVNSECKWTLTATP